MSLLTVMGLRTSSKGSKAASGWDLMVFTFASSPATFWDRTLASTGIWIGVIAVAHASVVELSHTLLG